MKTIRLAGLVVMALLLPFSMVTGLADTSPSQSPISVTVPVAKTDLSEGYTLCGESDTLSLYIHERTTAFYVKNKATGMEWHSSPPERMDDTFATGLQKMEMSAALNITYCRKEDGNENRINSYTGSVMDGNFKLYTMDNGFAVEYTFAELELTVPLKVWLEGEELRVSVKTSDIRLGDPDVFIEDVAVLQYFCAANATETGYLFVPDGSGALIGINNGKTACGEYSREVYGSDVTKQESEYNLKEDDIKLSLPVFGIKRGENACLAILDQGEELAYVKANTAFQVTGYANVYAFYALHSKMNYELAKNKTILYEEQNKTLPDLLTRYIFLTGEDADYSGMARSYRRVLEKDGMLPKTESVDPACYITLYGGVLRTKSRLGITTREVEPLTTIREAEEIVNEMRAAGVDSIVVRYKNWHVQEMKGKNISGLRVCGELGSKEDLLHMDGMDGVTCYPTLSNMLMYRKSGLFSRGAALDLSGSAVSLPDHSISLGTVTERPAQNVQTWPLFMSRFRQFVSAFSKFEGQRLGFDDLGQMLYEDFRSEGYKRTDARVVVEEALSTAEDACEGILLSNPNMYAVKYATDLVDVPMESSHHRLIDESVPFYQIVLSGTVRYGSVSLNMESAEDGLLKLLETGSQPHYSGYYRDASLVKGTDLTGLCSGNYRVFLQEMAQMYQTVAKLHEHGSNSRIYKHEKLTNGVFCTTYENGMAIYVNYTDVDYKADGICVEAKGYLVSKMGAE